MTAPAPVQVTTTDLRRLLFWVEAMAKALTTDDPYTALSEVYRHDEHLVVSYDADGVLDRHDARREYQAALDTLAALAGPRPTEETP